MDENYQRVIPRDLFNESKLLKCMGRLCLLIHDGLTPCPMTFEHDGEPFRIALLDSGALTVTNLQIMVRGQYIAFATTYNSKRPYPLMAIDTDYSEIPVFDDNGEWSDDFKEYFT